MPSLVCDTSPRARHLWAVLNGVTRAHLTRPKCRASNVTNLSLHRYLGHRRGHLSRPQLSGHRDTATAWLPDHDISSGCVSGYSEDGWTNSWQECTIDVGLPIRPRPHESVLVLGKQTLRSRVSGRTHKKRSSVHRTQIETGEKQKMILKTKTKSEGKPKWTPATATSEKQKEKGGNFLQVRKDTGKTLRQRRL